MRAWCVAVALVAAGVPADFRSGPQVGSTVPGQFEPLNVNGPDAGDEACLFCKYGNAPVVMIFAAKPSDGLGRLVRAVEAAAAANKGNAIGACAIVTDTSAATKQALGQLADDGNLRHVILAVIDPAKVKDYEINPDADVTVLLYSNKVVRSNFAFPAGKLDERAIADVTAEVKKHFGVR